MPPICSGKNREYGEGKLKIKRQIDIRNIRKLPLEVSGEGKINTAILIVLHIGYVSCHTAEACGLRMHTTISLYLVT